MDWKEWLEADNQEKSNIRSKITQQEKEKENSLLILIKKLKHLDKQVRIQTANKLSTLKDSKAVQPLIEALEDDEGGVKLAVVKALGNFKNHAIIEPLISLYKDDNSYSIVTLTFEEWEKASVVKYDSTWASIKYAQYQSKIMSKKRGKVQELRDKIGDVLWSMNCSKAISFIINKNHLVPYEYEFDNEGHKDRAGEMAREDNARIDSSIKNLIENLKARVVPLLKELFLNYGNGEKKFVERAFLMLREEWAIDPLIEDLTDEDWRIRKIIIETLASLSYPLSYPRIIEPLIETLKDNNLEVKIATIRALSRIEDEKAINALANPEISEYFIEILKDDNFDLKIAAVRILWYIRTEKATNALIDILQNANLELKCEIIRSLSGKCYPKTTETLLKILEEEINEAQLKMIISRNITLQELYNNEGSKKQTQILNPIRDIVATLRSLLDVESITLLTKMITEKNLVFKEEKFWALTLEVSEEKIASELRILKENEYKYEYNLKSDEVRKALQNLGLEGEPPVLGLGIQTNLNDRSYEEISKWKLFYALGNYCIFPNYKEISDCKLESWNDLNEFWIWEITSDIVWSLGEIGTKEAEESLLNILEIKLKEHESASDLDIVESRTVRRLRYLSIFSITSSSSEIGKKKRVKILENLLETEKDMILTKEIEKEIEKVDNEKVDIDVFLSGTTKSSRFKMMIIIDIIKEETITGKSDIVKVKRVKELAKKQNIDEEFVDKVIEQLRSNGEIYSPRDGFVKLA